MSAHFWKYIDDDYSQENQCNSDNSRQIGNLLKGHNTNDRDKNNPNPGPDRIGNPNRDLPETEA